MLGAASSIDSRMPCRKLRHLNVSPTRSNPQKLNAMVVNRHQNVLVAKANQREPHYENAVQKKENIVGHLTLSILPAFCFDDAPLFYDIHHSTCIDDAFVYRTRKTARCHHSQHRRLLLHAKSRSRKHSSACTAPASFWSIKTNVTLSDIKDI
jgi:hypothetical protein